MARERGLARALLALAFCGLLCQGELTRADGRKRRLQLREERIVCGNAGFFDDVGGN